MSSSKLLMMRSCAAIPLLLALLVACGAQESNTAATAETTVSTRSQSPRSSPDTTTATTDGSIAPTTTALVYPNATNELEVDDPPVESIAELSEMASVVLTGTVRTVTTAGRPDAAVDPVADEFVLLTIEPDEVLVGESTGEVVLGWDAFNVKPNGERVARWIANGVPPPSVGDRLLLFLKRPDSGFAAALDGAPTHQLVQLDGIAFLDESGAVTVTESGSPLGDAGTLAAVVEQLDSGA